LANALQFLIENASKDVTITRVSSHSWRYLTLKASHDVENSILPYSQYNVNSCDNNPK
jgi:hypothetical protein